MTPDMRTPRPVLRDSLRPALSILVGTAVMLGLSLGIRQSLGYSSARYQGARAQRHRFHRRHLDPEFDLGIVAAGQRRPGGANGFRPILACGAAPRGLNFFETAMRAPRLQSLAAMLGRTASFSIVGIKACSRNWLAPLT